MAARLSVTAKASTAPAPSSTRASATATPTGPTTVDELEFDSGRPSLVQIAPAASQFVVAGSVIDTAPEPDGWM